MVSGSKFMVHVILKEFTSIEGLVVSIAVGCIWGNLKDSWGVLEPQGLLGSSGRLGNWDIEAW